MTTSLRHLSFAALFCLLLVPAGDAAVRGGVAGSGVAPADTTPPSCSEVGITGPPSGFTITVRDLQSGISLIQLPTVTNANVVVPSFTIGTTGPVVITATKVSEASPIIVEVRITDVSGNVNTCRFSDALADLEITKSASPTAITAGQAITYTIVARNDGPNAATGVVVTDSLPAGLSAASATSTVGTCSGTTAITCTIGSLAVGSFATITIVTQGTPATPGPITNTAFVSGNENDPGAVMDNSASATVVVRADMSAIPALDARGLAMLAVLVAAAAMLVMRPS